MAISAAITGDSTAGRTILFSTALKSIASTPPTIQVAPIRPPKSACEELEGNPRNHVTRFHRMAPISPAKITTGLMAVSSTSPPEIVFATWTDRKAPARFRQAAIATAVLGRNAAVAIDVAMALAVSWKPFVKSKANAVNTTRTTINDASMDPALRSADPSPAGRCRPHCRCGERREPGPPTVLPSTPRGPELSHPNRLAEGPVPPGGLGRVLRSGFPHRPRVRPRPTETPCGRRSPNPEGRGRRRRGRAAGTPAPPTVPWPAGTARSEPG